MTDDQLEHIGHQILKLRDVLVRGGVQRDQAVDLARTQIGELARDRAIRDAATVNRRFRGGSRGAELIRDLEELDAWIH